MVPTHKPLPQTLGNSMAGAAKAPRGRWSVARDRCQRINVVIILVALSTWAFTGRSDAAEIALLSNLTLTFLWGFLVMAARTFES